MRRSPGCAIRSPIPNCSGQHLPCADPRRPPSRLAVSVDGSIAYQELEEESSFGTRDYASWAVGATLSAFGLDVDLRYFDTDLARDSCFGGGSTFGDLCDARFVWSVSKSF